MIEIARYIVSGLLLALVQTFILQEVNIAWWIKPMPYILLFLNIPVSVNKFGMLIGAFFFGMTIDALGGSMGMHTAACVSLVYFKYHIDAYFLDEHLVFFTFDYFRWSAILTIIWISLTSSVASVFFVQIFRLLKGKR